MWPAGQRVARPLEGRVCDARGCSSLSVRTPSPRAFIWCGSLWSDVPGHRCIPDHSRGTLALQVVAVSRPPHPWPPQFSSKTSRLPGAGPYFGSSELCSEQRGQGLLRPKEPAHPHEASVVLHPQPAAGSPRVHHGRFSFSFPMAASLHLLRQGRSPDVAFALWIFEGLIKSLIESKREGELLGRGPQAHPRGTGHPGEADGGAP